MIRNAEAFLNNVRIVVVNVVLPCTKIDVLIVGTLSTVIIDLKTGKIINSGAFLQFQKILNVSISSIICSKIYINYKYFQDSRTLDDHRLLLIVRPVKRPFHDDYKTT